MPSHDPVHALPVPDESTLDPDLQKYFKICREKLGLLPNVLKAYSFRPDRLRRFIDSYNEIMLTDGPLTKLEREMIAVTVSSRNRCYYCLVAHGQAVRQLSGDPELGDAIALNYRMADLSPRHRAMLDYAWKLTGEPENIGPQDRDALKVAGFSDEAVWDISETASFFNYTNRMAHAVEMRPNTDYHYMNREKQA
ncbi:peroxidase-related enzyme [Rhodospirillaceae bacterium KN72]|uniref:Peroxidase-related enzyme n=1 Tax=Pacificispira spongiicola TaxID=2729598 RepID=A0A7Y0E0U1_9PROT|nr:peroxidase-related enzyme [Pacificispira spongiicola]NMM44386.1 peroxidase-related enzyme [Pacificispira spongiicola]